MQNAFKKLYQTKKKKTDFVEMRGQCWRRKRVETKFSLVIKNYLKKNNFKNYFKN